MPSPQIIPTFT